MAAIRLRIEPPGAPPFQGEYEGPAVVLGRSKEATVPVPDASLSRLHARLFERDGAWYVEDLGSKNATLLNGRVLTTATRLAPHDTLRMAGTRVEVEGAPVGDGAGLGAASPAEEPLTGIFKSASMLEQRESAPRSLKLLNEVHRALARPLTHEALVDLILESAFAHLRPEEGALFLRRADGELYCAATRGHESEGTPFVLSKRLLREVADGGQAALVEDLTRDQRFQSSESLMDIGVRSLLAAPLLDAQGSAGMIVLHSRATLRRFQEEDLELLVSLASAATLRLRTITAAEEAARQKLLDKELALAHEIQMGMLPRRLPVRPEFELFAALRPARSVGGDLYDFILDGERLWFLVGDVSGKGVGAALFMAVTRTLFRAVVPGASGLGDVLARMNRELARDNDRAMFVTAFLGCLDVRTGGLDYANAGHNPPYLLEAAGPPWALTGARGLPLGVFEDQAHEAAHVTLRSGSLLFAFTDGVTEAFRPDGEAFGEARLEALLDREARGAPERLVEATLQTLDAFVAGAPPADDVTVLALRYRG